MKLFHWMMTTALLGAGSLGAEVPELLELVPEAKNYELIAKFNPTKWKSSGYTVDHSDRISGELKRVGYLLKLTGKDGKKSWVFTAMDPFTKDPIQTTVPLPDTKEFQVYVNNLEVASNVDGVKTGTFEKGNIEFWGKNYGPANAAKIPGATNQYDFGDSISNSGSYGSMQVHNYLEKQTVFSFSNLTQNTNCDLGIGNNPAGNPDWTFSKSGNNYANAELFIVGKFDNFKLGEAPATLNAQKMLLSGTTDRNPVKYTVGEPITFTIKADLGGQSLPATEYFINWERTGDDGKTVKGKEKLTEQPVTVNTSLDRPGFVRLRAHISDRSGRALSRTVKRYGRDHRQNVSFEGGAGVEIEKITQAAPEPADFDEFWQKQKQRLAAVPLKYKMEKVATRDGVGIYAVAVDCVGPRPVTGYLTIPENAAEKSLPARVSYHGYSVPRQTPPGSGSKEQITFNVNAHGFELNQDEDYYKKYAETIKSNGHGYGLDPKQNSNPEEAYFNGMALRLMRSLEFVKALPQWDGKTLIASGGSQGGLQSIWAASLDSDVSQCYSDVTWCSNLAGNKIDKRLAGWHPAWVEALGYYDTVNHAKRIKCPVAITRAGLGDYTCPPSGIAVLYNNITAPKRVVWTQGSDHGYVPPNAERFTDEQK